MKITSTIYPAILIGLLMTLTVGCKKKHIVTLPTITLSPVTNITSAAATSGGNITSDGGASVTSRGLCWSVNQNTTTSDNKIANGTGTGSFTSTLSTLTPGTIYNIRAYATNESGTGYSSQSTFTTLAITPILSTVEITKVTSTTATGGGTLTSDGGSSITARGVCWSTSQNPTTADAKTLDGTGTGSFTSLITGLLPGTTYYIRSYATNSIGTEYGGIMKFETVFIKIIDWKQTGSTQGSILYNGVTYNYNFVCSQSISLSGDINYIEEQGIYSDVTNKYYPFDFQVGNNSLNWNYYSTNSSITVLNFPYVKFKNGEYFKGVSVSKSISYGNLKSLPTNNKGKIGNYSGLLLFFESKSAINKNS
jgi:hypothetical protein